MSETALKEFRTTNRKSRELEKVGRWVNRLGLHHDLGQLDEKESDRLVALFKKATVVDGDGEFAGIDLRQLTDAEWGAYERLTHTARTGTRAKPVRDSLDRRLRDLAARALGADAPENAKLVERDRAADTTGAILGSTVAWRDYGDGFLAEDDVIVLFLLLNTIADAGGGTVTVRPRVVGDVSSSSYKRAIERLTVAEYIDSRPAPGRPGQFEVRVGPLGHALRLRQEIVLDTGDGR
jgi:hypothetical protein